MMRMLESGLPEEGLSEMTPGEGTHELTSTVGAVNTDSILDEQFQEMKMTFQTI